LSGNREEYLLYHESSSELKLAEKWDNLPDECKFCEQLGAFSVCKLKESEEESSCPLNDLVCKQCQYYCDVYNRAKDIMDYGFCSEREIQILNDETACQYFKEYKGDKNNE